MHLLHDEHANYGGFHFERLRWLLRREEAG
jgi:hypothetical protein